MPFAYFVTTPGKQVDTEELVAHCRSKLAEFKVPAHFVQLSEMPLGSTAKIDKKALLQIWKDTQNA
ncbi:hypothetical protein [Pseudomonas sp. TH10]|uniref:AMP-binding enzyme n=1 Tax=Pseudomonas sp. TH10 TaxID=2796376 RepID=UPI001F5BACBF|nr:hypothetical protein [Pseudomonas sp. TH10]